MTFKIIISGHLEFGSARTYAKVVDTVQHRVEVYYKNDIVLKEEEIFNEASHNLEIPRAIVNGSEKAWKNTTSLLELIAQYAVAGSIHAWMLNEGKLIQQVLIEPRSDKTAVQSFLSGRELVKEDGRESEAIRALSRAIDKCERHALAYERRGYVNFRLNNIVDAIYDFTKSIDINPNTPDAYLGRALIAMQQQRYAEAIDDLSNAIKNSIPHQPIYWRARRLKGECHLEQEEIDKAIFELKLFTKRAFTPDNPNFETRKKAFFDYGRALLTKGDHASAIQAFDQCSKCEGAATDLTDAEIFLFRGIALQKAGKNGFQEDWKKAASIGSKRAAHLLQQYP